MEKIKIDRAELFDELWQPSLTKNGTAITRTAKKYDVSAANLRLACAEADIPMPENGMARPELPASDKAFVEIAKIAHHNPRNAGTPMTTKSYDVCLLQLLYKYSSPEHMLSRPQLQRLMLSEYGLELDRRAVTTNLEVLRAAGWDISEYDRRGGGYCLMSRSFALPEVRLLMDSVYSNPAIPQKQTEKLIAELQELLPVNQRRSYKHLKVLDHVRKTDNRELFLNIELLDEAIAEKKLVHFTYCRYDVSGELVARRERSYSASPLALYAANGFYYLLCINEGHNNIAPYRLDKIKDMVKTERRAQAPPADFRPEDFANSGVLMYGGELVRAKLLCKNEVLDYMVDTFGRDAKMVDNGDGTFNMTVTGSFMGLKLWALHYLDRVKVLWPVALRDAVVDMIKDNMYGI
ncbi:MAG: WYL domain-containing protein [Oscillospiraceae bacterium]|nr:WYL domain-containing protein [Oscillospiraceae bacterium]